MGAIRIKNLASARVVAVANLAGKGGAFIDERSYGLYAANNQGRVRIQRCTFDGLGMHEDKSDGARVESSADVALAACTSRGDMSQPGPQFQSGGAGIRVEASHVSFSDSTFQGGRGRDASGFSTGGNGGDGGDGMVLFNDSSAFASNCTFLGGDGGSASCATASKFAGFDGYGGDGISSFANTPASYLLDCATIGGESGEQPPECFAWLGSDGQDIDDDGFGTTPITLLPGNARTLSVSTPVRDDERVELRFFGQPGDQVALISSAQPDRRFVAAWNGMLLVKTSEPPQATRMLKLGSIPVGGILSVSLPVADVPFAVGGRTVHMQALFRDVNGVNTLSGHRCMVVVDQAY